MASRFHGGRFCGGRFRGGRFSNSGAGTPAAMVELPTTSTNTITHTHEGGSETWTASSNVLVGHFDDGVPFVFAPSGAVLDTVEVSEPGYVTGKSEKNPQFTGVKYDTGNTGTQPYDNRGPAYSAANEVAYPVTMSPGDTLVKARGVTEASFTLTTNRSREGVAEYFGLVVVDEIPTRPEGWYTLAPALVQWTGRGTPQPTNIDLDGQIAAMRARLPGGDWVSASNFPSIATYAEVIARVNRLAVALWQVGGGDNTYQTLSPFGVVEGRNYGVDYTEVIQGAFLWCMTDEGTEQERRNVLLAILQLGKQCYDAMMGGDNAWAANGAHMHFWQMAVCLHLGWSGNTAALATFISDLGGNWHQAFHYAQEIIDSLQPHSDPTKPSPSFIRALQSVGSDGGGDFVEILVGKTQFGDHSNLMLQGMTLKKTDDTASSIVLTGEIEISGNSARLQKVYVEDNTGFATNDLVYCEPAFTPAVGDVGWSISGASSLNELNVVHNPVYSGAQRWPGAMLGLTAAGIYDPSFEAVKDFCIQRSIGNQPLSTPTKFASIHGAFLGDGNFPRDMWELVWPHFDSTWPDDMSSIIAVTGPDTGFWDFRVGGDLYTDTGGTTAATNGQAVALADPTEGELQLSQADAARRPLWSSGSGLVFDGAADSIYTPRVADRATYATILMVVNSTDNKFVLVTGNSDSDWIGAVEDGSSSASLVGGENVGIAKIYVDGVLIDTNRDALHTAICDGNDHAVMIHKYDANSATNLGIGFGEYQTATTSNKLDGTIKGIGILPISNTVRSWVAYRDFASKFGITIP